MSELVKDLNQFFDRQAWLDRYAKPVQKAVSAIFQSGGAVGQSVADFLNGVWLGHPLHPVLTDIPVGAWMATVTLDAMEAAGGGSEMAKAADITAAIGVAGAVGSAVSGLADWQHTTGEARRTGFLHATLNTLALGLFIGSLFARKDGSRGLGRTLAVAGFTVVSASAYLGGDLVYRQKMGVNHAPEEADTAGFVPVIALDQLEEDRLTLVMLTNIPLVMVRHGSQVSALAETCAHLGGPLADGKLGTTEQGELTVTCPWHGSTFVMDNGSVVRGPSAYPQPCFETRIVDGQVEVRRRAPESAE